MFKLVSKTPHLFQEQIKGKVKSKNFESSNLQWRQSVRETRQCSVPLPSTCCRASERLRRQLCLATL